MKKDRPLAKDDPALRAGKDSTCPDPTEAPHDAKLDHPIGTGVGAVAGGAAAGAAIGSVAGPIGTAVGAAAGTLAGAVAGHTFADAVEPVDDDQAWCEMHARRTDAPEGYDQYRPAYRYGAMAAVRHPGPSFEEIEPALAAGWDGARGPSTLSWPQARPAVRDAWLQARDRSAAAR